MKKSLLHILNVCITPSLAIAIAWSGGYNFDQRTPRVAQGFCLTLVCMVMIAAIIEETNK